MTKTEAVRLECIRMLLKRETGTIEEIMENARKLASFITEGQSREIVYVAQPACAFCSNPTYH